MHSDIYTKLYESLTSSYEDNLRILDEQYLKANHIAPGTVFRSGTDPLEYVIDSCTIVNIEGELWIHFHLKGHKEDVHMYYYPEDLTIISYE